MVSWLSDLREHCQLSWVFWVTSWGWLLNNTAKRKPRGFSSKIYPLFKILKMCSKVSAVKECHIVGIVAKLHVFYEIAFGKLYGLELVSISFWAIIWHGIGLWIHPGIKQSRGSAVVKVSSFAFLRRRAVFWVSLFRSDVYPVFPARPRLRLTPGWIHKPIPCQIIVHNDMDKINSINLSKCYLIKDMQLGNYVTPLYSRNFRAYF